MVAVPLYFVGSLSFLVASIAGLALSGGGDGGGGGTWACDFPFAVGSAAFFCGAGGAAHVEARAVWARLHPRDQLAAAADARRAGEPELGRRRRRCPPLWGLRREQSVYLLLGALSSLDVCALAAAAVNDTERAGRVAVAAEIATSACPSLAPT